MKHKCKICRCEYHLSKLDSKGLCHGCHDAHEAAKLGISYGKYIANVKHSGESEPEKTQEAPPIDEDVKICPYCGIRPIIKPRRSMCGDAECFLKAIEARNKKYMASKKKPICICEQCGKEFEAYRPGVRFCSASCNMKHSNEVRRAKRPKTKPCRNCGAEFAIRGSTLYCSDKCQQEANLLRRLSQLQEIKEVTL